MTICDFLVLALVAGVIVATPAPAPAGTGEELAATTATSYERLSLTPDGGEFADDAFRSAVSADGRFVAFWGRNPGSDIYVRDRLLGTTELVSMAQVGPRAGGPAGSSSTPAISSDGRYVAFLSRASDLVSGDGNNLQDIFVLDRDTGTIQRVGRRSSQDIFEMDDEMPAISGDGKWVAFVTEGLEWWGFSLRKKVYVTQRGLFGADLVSRHPRDHEAVHPGLDADGTRIAYLALIEDQWVLVLHDRTAGTYQEIATVGPGSLHPFLLFLSRPSVSPDGRTVAYLTYSDDRLKSRVEVWEEGEGPTTLFEADASATGQKVESPSLSADGQRVLFTLVDGVPSGGVITLGQGQAYVHDRSTGQTSLVTAGPDGEPVAGDARYTAMSADGSLATFSTTAALDPGDTNGRLDVYGTALAAADTSPPVWPDGAALTVEDIGTSVLRLRWPEATDDVGVTAYAVSAGGTQVAVTAATELAVTGLAPATTYEFAVVPRDAAGNTGEPLTASATTLGEAAEGEATLVATAEPGGIVRLHWDASASAQGGYRVLRATGDDPFEEVASTSETAHTDTGLLGQTAYRYRVLAVDGDGTPHPHTVEAAATTPALSIGEVEWSAPRIPRTNELRLGSDLAVTVRAEPNRTATAALAYTAAEGSGADDASLTLELAEQEPGVYRGSVPLAEGVASVAAIVARLSDGVPEHDATAAAAGLPATVSGRLLARVEAPEGSMPGGKLFAWSEELKAGTQHPVDGGVEVEVPVSPGEYVLRVMRDDGVVAAEVATGPVGPGRQVTVDLLPELPATLTVRVVDHDGAPMPGVDVRVTDEADGRLVATQRTGSQGATGVVRGLTWRSHLRATAVVDPLRFESTEGTVVLEPGANEVTAVVSARPRGWVEGRIVDHRGDGVADAAVRVHQTVGGLAASAAGTTGEDGRYRVEAFAGPGAVHVSHRNVPPPEPVQVEVPAAGTAIADFEFPQPEDYEIVVDLYTRHAGSGWQGPLPIDWRVAAHLRLDIHTPATRRLSSATTTLRAQPGQRIEVCADGREAALPATCEAVVLDSERTVRIELRLAQVGAVQARLVTADGAEYRSQYEAQVHRVEADGSRRFVARRSGAGPNVLIPVDQTGEHELVVTGYNVSSLAVRTAVSQFAIGDAGSVVLAPRGPFQGAGNALEAVRPVVLPGDVVEWRTSYRNGTAATLAGAVALLPVPAGTAAVAAGTLRDGEPVEAVPGAGALEVALGDLEPGASGVLRHRVRLVDEGLTAVGGTALIRAAGLAPSLVGAGAVTVAGVTLEAPHQSASLRIATSGRAPAGADVEILADGLVLARTVASAGGYWHAGVDLPDRGRGYEHALAARSLAGDALVHSAVAFVTVDDTLPVMTQVAVSQHDGRRVVFDPAGGVARFPYVFVPGRPMLVDVTFADPDRVAEVVVRIGTATATAERQPGGAYRASLGGGRGDLFIDYEPLRAPLGLTDPAQHQVPTEAQLRSRLRDPLAGFTDVTVVESPGSNRATLSARLPGAGPDARMTADLSMAPDQMYTPTAEDVEAERVTGVPVYGLSLEESADGLSAELVAYIPEHALAEGATAADALALVTQAVVVAPAGWRGGGGAFAAPAVVSRGSALAQAQVAVPAVRIGFKLLFEGVNGGSDIYGAWQSGGLFDEMSALLDRLTDCPPDVIRTYTRRLDNMARSALIVQATQAAMAVAGLFVGPATFGLGTLAIWAATYAVGQGMDYAIQHNFDRLKREIQNLDCVRRRRGKKFAEPVWIHDPSGFVYEAVESNRLEGVTATVMSAPAPDGPWTVWDAEWFGQDNPQATGADGRYGWDVPEGWWMVAYERAGYLTAYSDALEVLPPHFDVNEGLVPVAPPAPVDVTAIAGAGSSVLVAFDQFMRADAVEAVGIEVSADASGGGEAAVAGDLAAAGAQASPTGERLATRFRFTPSTTLEAGAELAVTIPDVVQNHAGRTMPAPVTFSVTVAPADTEPPAASATVSPPANAAGWHRDTVTVELSATDAGSGVAELAWELSGAETGTGALASDSASVTVSAEGETTVTFHAVDRAGNTGEPAQVTVRIDRTPPVATCRATPGVLWPPNHRLVGVTVSVEAADELSGPAGFALEAATSSEPDNAPGGSDGNTTGDVDGFQPGAADLEGRLRAERDEDGAGRVYTLEYRASDVAGNASTCAAVVVVPLDLQGGRDAGAGAAAPR